MYELIFILGSVLSSFLYDTEKVLLLDVFEIVQSVGSKSVSFTSRVSLMVSPLLAALARLNVIVDTFSVLLKLSV